VKLIIRPSATDHQKLWNFHPLSGLAGRIMRTCGGPSPSMLGALRVGLGPLRMPTSHSTARGHLVHTMPTAARGFCTRSWNCCPGWW
jgi:hypothetical protein